MLTPSESNDLLRGSFQLESSSKMNDQSGCWDLTPLLSLPVNQIVSLDVNSTGTQAINTSKKSLAAWSDPDWDAHKFAEPRTIPRCWDVSSLY